MTASGKIQVPLMLIILDGWGYSADPEGNATLQAKTPHIEELLRTFPKTLLKASGKAVGLPEGQMGNSEVGHLNLGAGRVVYQELTRISQAIEDQTFSANATLLKSMQRAKESGKALHLLGLVSDGGVHSHLDHLFALLDMVAQQGLRDVYIHAILDGRDVLPQSAKSYLAQLEQKLTALGCGQIATVSGRYYAMDRDKRWDRVEKAYLALVEGEGPQAPSAVAALERAYEMKVSDEFVEPTIIIDVTGTPKALIEDGDSVIFFNFRADRARQITRAFVDDPFVGFEQSKHPRVHFVCLTEYDQNYRCPAAFPPQNLENTLGQVLAENDIRQLRAAETEKYAHVTFFFNGGVEDPYPWEDRCLIPSPQVATYNLKPGMSAHELTEEVLARLAGDTAYQVIILNFANPDMVGHTGFFEATVEALEVVDTCVGRLAADLEARGGSLLVTADHGNAEQMVDPETSSPFTAHTTNKVPFILADAFYKGRSLRSSGALCDIAPTILDILGLKIPSEMTGQSLLIPLGKTTES